MGGKTRAKEPEDLPGPGNYEDKNKKFGGEGPQYSMYPKRDEKYNDNPGPGQYEASEEKQKGISMGERVRAREADELPGPGNYEEKGKIGKDGPQYSMGNRRPEKYNDNPGPGQYEEHRKRTKGVKIGEKLA